MSRVELSARFCIFMAMFRNRHLMQNRVRLSTVWAICFWIVAPFLVLGFTQIEAKQIAANETIERPPSVPCKPPKNGENLIVNWDNLGRLSCMYFRPFDQPVLR